MSMNHSAENALAERMNGILKSNMDWTESSKARCSSQAVDQAIRLFGTRRPHTALEGSVSGPSASAFAPFPQPLSRMPGERNPGARPEPRLEFGRPAPVGATPLADHPSSRFADS